MSRLLLLILLLPLALLPAARSNPAMATDFAQASPDEPTADSRSPRKTTGSRGMASSRPSVPSDLPDSEPSIRPNPPREDAGSGKDTDAKDQGQNRRSDPQ